MLKGKPQYCACHVKKMPKTRELQIEKNDSRLKRQLNFHAVFLHRYGMPGFPVRSVSGMTKLRIGFDQPQYGVMELKVLDQIRYRSDAM